MESLLSVSFDNIYIKDGAKIRKGLRQIEGLLAQICLPKCTSRLSPQKRKTSQDSGVLSPKRLGSLRKDPAFQEFFRLQESFEWNVASRLVSCLERLLGMQSNNNTDLLIASTLDLLQGVLLLHPPSRTLLGREIYMNLLLDLLDDANPPRLQSQALLVLVTALLSTPRNTRTFENIDGLLTVTSLFKSRSTSRDVKVKALEFLYFYLMPEAPAGGSPNAPTTDVLQRSPSKTVDAFQRHTAHAGDGSGSFEESTPTTKTTEEKQQLLGRYLNNVAELVQDLSENAAFTAVAG